MSAAPDLPSSSLRTLRSLSVEVIDESPQNPRKTFGDLGELTDSIRRKGVLSPVLVRPMGERFELVYGHRRLRAARAAGLEEVPAIVAELSDREALEEALVENAQRADVPPLEEAEAFRRLMDDHGLGAEDLAQRTGKSLASIYARLKLCELGPEGREALEAGKLTASTALLVARCAKKDQNHAVAVLEPYEGQPISYRDAVRRLAWAVLRIEDAPFDPADGQLIAGVGPCATCPKNAANQRDLFGTTGDGDVCTDRSCWDEKRAATAHRKIEEGKRAGLKVLSVKETEAKVAGGGDPRTYAQKGEFVPLDQVVLEDPKRRTYREILGATPPPIALAKTRDGDVVEVVKREHVAPVVKELQPRKREPAKDAARGNKANAEDQLHQALEARARAAVAKVVEKRQPNSDDWKLLARIAYRNSELDLAPFAARVGVKLPPAAWLNGRYLDDAGFEKFLAKLFGHQVRALAFEAVLNPLWEDLHFDGKSRDALYREALEHFGVDLGKLEAQVRSELEQPPTPAPVKPPKKKPGGPAAALAKKKPAKKGGRRG